MVHGWRSEIGDRSGVTDVGVAVDVLAVLLAAVVHAGEHLKIHFDINVGYLALWGDTGPRREGG